MEKASTLPQKFQPELYCLRCQRMEWDDEARCCANFQGPRCPLTICTLLAGLQLQCLVV